MSESKSHVPAYDELVPKKEAASAASNKAALCKICKKTVHAKDGNKLLFEKITKKKKQNKKAIQYNPAKEESSCRCKQWGKITDLVTYMLLLIYAV